MNLLKSDICTVSCLSVSDVPYDPACMKLVYKGCQQRGLITIAKLVERVVEAYQQEGLFAIAPKNAQCITAYFATGLTSVRMILPSGIENPLDWRPTLMC